MPTPLNVLFSIVVSYLLGSIPTAYLFARVTKGIDIRQHGSGNVGATNAFRVLGKLAGTIVLLIDILKGILATTLVADFFQFNSVLGRVVLGAVVVAGHNWTIFLQFKGGKGIATSLGVLIGIATTIVSIRPVLLATVLAWFITFFLSGFVSLSSIMASLILLIAMILTSQPLEIVCLGIVFCLWIVLRHRPNIKKLLSGTENRVKLPFRK